MITIVVGKEIEKIKGDFESYLNGLNMVGEISYSQYSELYDEGVKQIQRAYELGKSELEKENAELKDKLNNLSKVAEVRLANWQKYEEENKELKERNNKAKELLEDLIKFQPYIDREAFFISLGNEWKTAIYRAEQFLMEIKENDL